MFRIRHHFWSPARRPTVLSTVAVLAAALLVPEPAHAQVGLRGGVNLTDWFGDDVESTDRKTGLSLGASFGLVSIGPVQLVAEAYYRQKGTGFALTDLETGETPPEELPETVEFGIDYLEVPVLARVNLPPLSNSLGMYVIGGPAFAWRIDCGFETELSSGTSGTNCDDLSSENLGETLENYDVGAAGGLGFDIALPGRVGALNLEARYTGGLKRIGADGTDVKNRAFSLTLGYSFGMPGSLGGVGGPGGAPAGGMPVSPTSGGR